MAIDKIGSKALLDCSVAAADIAPGTITTAKLAGSITNAKLANSTVTINGTAIALGASGSIDPIAWQSVVVSDGSTVTTMVAGRGYFVNNTSAAGIVKLPISASAGDTIAIKDYAGNFGTNNLTIQRNGHNIQGVANDGLIITNRASLELVYIDATKGWLYTNESNVADLERKVFVSATGGTVATSGNFKIHSFTGDGNFVVSTGNVGPGTAVDYVVVGGGGGGGSWGGGGGGAGGYRESSGNSGPYTASPLATPTGITVTAQTYPITVGAGGANAPGYPGRESRRRGNNSVFSTITSTGGGRGGANCGPGCGAQGSNGGSGGGSDYGGPIGNGNTPPVSPPQGNSGGLGYAAPNYIGGGGGGAGAVGNAATAGGSPPKYINAGPGGAGVVSHITGSPVARAGGGGGGGNDGDGSGQSGAQATGGSGGGGNGGYYPSTSGANGTANTGGGGGAAGATSPTGNTAGPSGAGGKGIVILRYQFQ